MILKIYYIYFLYNNHLENIEYENKKYKCYKCKYFTNNLYDWNIHINREIHLFGIKKKRSDLKDPFKCEKCDYQSKNKIILIQHYLNYHGNFEERKNKFKFFCEYCNYGTFAKSFIEKHNNSKKHNNNKNLK